LLESQLELIGVLEIDDIGLGKIDENPPTLKSQSSEKKQSKGSDIEFSAVEDEETENSSYEKKTTESKKLSFSSENLESAYAKSQINRETTPQQPREIISKGDRRRIKLSDQFII
jgi:hypothetical protein